MAFVCAEASVFEDIGNHWVVEWYYGLKCPLKKSGSGPFFVEMSTEPWSMLWPVSSFIGRRLRSGRKSWSFSAFSTWRAEAGGEEDAGLNRRNCSVTDGVERSMKLRKSGMRMLP